MTGCEQSSRKQQPHSQTARGGLKGGLRGGGGTGSERGVNLRKWVDKGDIGRRGKLGGGVGGKWAAC
jgi:hypothetical protein